MDDSRIGDRAGVWLVRAGEGGYALRRCIDASAVALRFHTVGDPRTMSGDEVEAAIAESGTRVNFGGLRSMLDVFVHEVAVGDVVLTPHSATREVYVGVVTGDYHHQQPSPVFDFRHFRDVDWLGSVARDDVDKAIRRQIDRPPTIYRVPDEEAWREVARKAVDGVDSVVRPPDQDPPVDAALRAGAAPAQMHRPTVGMCTSCFTTKALAVMVDDVCDECRD